MPVFRFLATVAVIILALLAPGQADAYDPAVEKAFAELKSSSGGSKSTQQVLSEFVGEAIKTYRLRVDVEARLVEIIESESVSRDSKLFAAEQLYRICDEDTIPALKRMLTQNDTWDIACRGLARVQHSKAEQTLLEAVPTATGKRLIGIVEALGNRHDPVAVPVLRNIAQEGDVPTTEAALTALSKIPGTSSIEALDWCRGNLTRKMRPAATDAYVQAALTSLEHGQRQPAIDAFEALMVDFEPADVKARGLRGLIQAYGEDAVPTIVEALTSGIPELEAVAAEEAKSVPGRKATEAFVKAYASLTPENQAVLLHALGVRGDDYALETLLLAAQSRIPVVRLGAIEALGRFNHPDVLQVLLKSAATGSEEEMALARQALDALTHPGVNDELLVAAMNADNAVRAEAMKMIAARHVQEGVPVVMRVAARDVKPVRLEALKALGAIGTAQELPDMVSMLLEDWSAPDIAAIGEAIIAVARRAPEGKTRTDAVSRALTGGRGPEDSRLTLVSILAAIGDDTGVPALEDVARESTGRAQVAAVETLVAWPTPAALDPLDRVARESKDAHIRSMALDGALRQLEHGNHGRTPEQRVKYYERLAKVAQTPEEKARIANALAAISSPDSEKVRAKLLQDIEAANSVTSRAEPPAE
jgi:HEAT repeat protein